MKIFIRLLSTGVFVILLISNAFFINQLLDTKKQQVEESKKYERNFYGQNFELPEYSHVEFPLTNEGKAIITQARKFHIIPTLISSENFDKYVCSGYLWELSETLWGKGSPYYIGMMEQNDKKPASAWQLAYSYEYVGGKVLYDFSKKFSLDHKDFWQKIDFASLQDFFATAFSSEALLGDIGFFYTETEYLNELKKYENYNSHIGKNMGISEFIYQVKNKDISKNTSQILAQTLGCNALAFEKLFPVLEYYQIQHNGKKAILYSGDLYEYTEGYIGEKIHLKYLDTLTFRDIGVAHFLKGAKLQGLFEMSCSGEFFPINILQISSKLIEKI